MERRPSTLLMTRMEAALLAGPAISSTKAAPGVSPLSIKATAMGMDPVAQRYMGNEKSRTKSILIKELPAKRAKNSSGTSMVMAPATTKPIKSHLPMSCIISTKAYRRASTMRLRKRLGSAEAAVDSPDRLEAEEMPDFCEADDGANPPDGAVAAESSNQSTNHPPPNAVIRATTGRIRAKGSPSRE